MKRIISVLALVVVSVLMIGCATSTSQEKPEPESSKPATGETAQTDPVELEIIKSGWSAENGYVHYGIGIKNPNINYEASGSTLTITGKDADGKILFSDEQRINFMLPGAEYYFGCQAGNGTSPTTIDFALKTRDPNWIKNEKQSMEIYTIANANEVVGDYGRINYTGEITANEEWSDVSSAWVSAILRDEAGEIVAGYFGFTDISSSGETAIFDIPAYDTPAHASFEIHAMPWN